MAYGKGRNKNLIKRMADLGTLAMSAELSDLRSRIVDTLQDGGRRMARGHPSTRPVGQGPRHHPAEGQSEASRYGLNNVWAEKARLIAKSAILEQWKRGQHNLFGRFRNIATLGDIALEDGSKRLVNLPEEFSKLLTAEDAAALQDLSTTIDFAATLKLFRDLADGDCGFPAHHASALRALAGVVRYRFKRPAWRDDAVVQLHLDYRCMRGGKDALAAVLHDLGKAVQAGSRRRHACLSHQCRRMAPESPCRCGS